jgi:hypothetical protein
VPDESFGISPAPLPLWLVLDDEHPASDRAATLTSAATAVVNLFPNIAFPSVLFMDGRIVDLSADRERQSM